jgi:hypothetical protein
MAQEPYVPGIGGSRKPADIHAQPAQIRMNKAVAQNTRQFGNVQQGLSNTLGRLRTQHRLQGMLRKFK